MAGAPPGGLVEQGAGGVEGDGGRRGFATARAAGARRRDRIGRPQWVAVPVVERDGLAGEARVCSDNGDDATGEESLVELPDAAVEIDGAILADAAAAMDGERRCERGLVNGAAGRAGPHLGGRLAVEAPCGARW